MQNGSATNDDNEQHSDGDEELFLDLEMLAASAPIVKDNGDVLHRLYVGTPRTRMVDGDGNVATMSYACVLCHAGGRAPFKTPDGIAEHFRRYHRIKSRMVIPKGKVAKSHIIGKEIESAMDGEHEETALVAHACNFCRAMINAGRKFRRAVVDGVTRDACVACRGRLRGELARAVRSAARSTTNEQPTKETPIG